MDYQQHRYMRLPPPSQPPQPPQPPPGMDPHHQYHNQYPQPPRAPQGSWYPNQFQYQQNHQSHPSPSPPPPVSSHWGPPPHSDHSAYPPPPPPPYTGYPHGGSPGNHFPPHPPPPHLPPRPIPHPHAQANQEWSNPNWPHHHGWDSSAHCNVEDWGAKAREWANARAAMPEQQPQSQITALSRPEDQNHHHEQYQQAAGTYYQDAQQQSLPSLNYQQFPAPAASPHRPPLMYPQEGIPGSSAPPYNIVDGHQTYHVKDGTSALDSNAGFLHQESLPTTSTINQQEVPSSYSSVSEKEDPTNRKEQSYNPSVSSVYESQQQWQPSMLGGHSGASEQLIYGSQAIDPTADQSNRPLDFTPRYNGHASHVHSNFAAHHESMGAVRGADPVTAMPSISAWTPSVAPPVVYPPIPPVLPSHDPYMSLPSTSGHAAPPFGRFPGPSFQPPVTTASGPFGHGSGAPLHPASAFPGDTFGSFPERPKKAPVPNWLKEEIIKNKAALAKSSFELPREEEQSIEDEVDKSFAKGDQADSKSVDSSRSTEEEDDDEDYVEAARTAAINQEIKRVLTEVLLKVTDELFEEIATQVLSEEENDHKTRPFSTAVSTAKASAKVVVSGRGKESDGAGPSEISSSSSPGNLLGLANYASDDEDADESQISKMPESRNNYTIQPSSNNNHSEIALDAAEDSSSLAPSNQNYRSENHFESDLTKGKNHKMPVVSSFSENGSHEERGHSYSTKKVSRNEVSANTEKLRNGNNGSLINDFSGERDMIASEVPERSRGNNSGEDTHAKESGQKSDKGDDRENRKSSSREVENNRYREDEKGDESHRRRDDRHARKEKVDDRNGLKDLGVKSGKKARESESRRLTNSPDAKDEKKEGERSRRGSAKDIERKREHAIEEDRSRRKFGSESSRHKRRRSPSPNSRGRSSKDNSGSHANDSSDETSDDSKRKSHSRRRNLSPSPVRSKKRQVSRSPHSKHSQRRHSPYSSHDNTRGRRSRSRSPAKRQR